MNGDDDFCTPGCPDDVCRAEGGCAWPKLPITATRKPLYEFNRDDRESPNPDPPLPRIERP